MPLFFRFSLFPDVFTLISFTSDIPLLELCHRTEMRSRLLQRQAVKTRYCCCQCDGDIRAFVLHAFPSHFSTLLLLTFLLATVNRDLLAALLTQMLVAVV